MSQHSSFNISSQDVTRSGPSLSQANLQSVRNRNLSYRQNTTNINPIIENNVHQFQSSSILKNNLTGLSGINRSMSKRSSEISSLNDNFYVPAVKLENTYKLGPDDAQKFNSLRIQNAISDILEEYFENYKYDASKSRELVKRVSEEIKGKIKPMIYKRYKVIVNLTIGQNLGQNIMISSRSMWNIDTDNSCTVEYHNSTMFAIATVFVTYFD